VLRRASARGIPPRCQRTSTSGLHAC